MITISLAELIEHAIADPDQDNLTGNLEDFMRLLSEENLARFEESHQGVFAFLVFHPSADEHVAEYVRSGTLVSDTGPRIIAFFTLDEDAMAIPSSPVSDLIEVDGDVHIAYEVTSLLFTPQVPPPLPGVLFTAHVSGTGDAVYVPLGDLADTDGVRSHLRAVFSLADKAWSTSRNRSAFADRFTRALASEKIVYMRSDRRSMGEWMTKSYRRIVDRGLELMAVLGGVIGGSL
jgi:hypothetical protein